MDAALIVTPNVDFQTLVGVAHKALGYSPAAVADSSHIQLSETERYLSCLAALHDKNAPTGLAGHLLQHAFASVMFAFDERDAIPILELGAMPFVLSESVRRGTLFGVMSGTLAQWRDAILAGIRPVVSTETRQFYGRVMKLFEGNGLNLWKGYTVKTHTDNTLLLEDKRK